MSRPDAWTKCDFSPSNTFYVAQSLHARLSWNAKIKRRDISFIFYYLWKSCCDSCERTLGISGTIVACLPSCETMPTNACTILWSHCPHTNVSPPRYSHPSRLTSIGECRCSTYPKRRPTSTWLCLQVARRSWSCLSITQHNENDECPHTQMNSAILFRITLNRQVNQVYVLGHQDAFVHWPTLPTRWCRCALIGATLRNPSNGLGIVCKRSPVSVIMLATQ